MLIVMHLAQPFINGSQGLLQRCCLKTPHFATGKDREGKRHRVIYQNGTYPGVLTSGPAGPDLHGEQQSRSLPLPGVDPPRNLLVLGICWRVEGTFCQLCMERWLCRSALASTSFLISEYNIETCYLFSKDIRMGKPWKLHKQFFFFLTVIKFALRKQYLSNYHPVRCAHIKCIIDNKTSSLQREILMSQFLCFSRFIAALEP